MKLYLVRHGEPSYTPCTIRKLKGQGRDLAALNEDGIKQILDITVPKLADCDAQIILSSPYTRSLQTAAILASKTGLVTKVVHDLHEWVPDMTFNYGSYKELMAIYEDFYNHKGIFPQEKARTTYTLWEPLEVFRQRVLHALVTASESYSSCIITAHGMVIQSLTGEHIEYGDVIEMTLGADYELPPWTFNAPKKQDEKEDLSMKQINLGSSGLRASEIVMGCMRIDTMNVKELSAFVDHAMDEGINLFDHADIYGNNTCETLFGEMLHSRPGLREKIKLQTKCSIRSGYYDLSKDHILNSVDESLKRLQTEYIDLFILHRPDTLMEPDEIAGAFDSLLYSGKVLNFGVSNFNSMQIEMLKMSVSLPILVNQVQFGIMHTGMIDNGLQVNTTFEGAFDRDGSILEYCRINNITLQAWSPFQYGFFEGPFIDNPKFPELNATLARIAKQKNATKSAIALAWILRHPAKMQAIIGTTNAKRLSEICVGTKIELNREEWYAIYRAAGNILP